MANYDHPYVPQQNPMYTPYPQVGMDPFYEQRREEKHRLGKTASGLSWMLLLVVLLMAALPSVETSFLRMIGYRWQGELQFSGYTPLLYYLVNGVTYLLALALPPLLDMGVKRLPLQQVLPFQKTRFSTALACVFLGMGVCMLANFPANWMMDFLEWAGYNGTVPDSPLTGEPSIQALYVISLAVIPALVEELVFRGAVLHGLRRFGDGFAIVGSAFLFGMFHGNLVQLPFAFFCGLALAFVVVKTGNLWVSVAIHFLNNGLSAAITLLQWYQGDVLANAVYLIAFSAWVLLGIASVVFLALRRKRFFDLHRPNSLLTAGQKFIKLIVNPGGLVLFGYCVLSCVMMMYL